MRIGIKTATAQQLKTLGRCVGFWRHVEWRTRPSRPSLLLVSALLFSGCGYIHFGRLQSERTNDAALQQAYVDLSIERKILQQELVLSRKETDTLRAALDRTSGPALSAVPSVTQALDRTTKELEALRVSYAKLQAERAQAAAPVTMANTADVAVLRQEKLKLQQELSSARNENATLAGKLKESLAANERAQAELSQLNADLTAQRRARENAEQATAALRARLEVVMARAGRADATAAISPEPKMPSPAASSEQPKPAPATTLADLHAAKSPPSGAVPTAELRSTTERSRPSPDARTATSPKPTPTIALDPAPPRVAGSADKPAASTPATPTSSRTYTVQAGDTLEKISAKFYGTADQWGKIYAENAETLTRSQGLKPGLVLQIPEK